MTFGDELKFTSILSISQTPKGHLLCAPNLVRRNQTDLSGKCRSLPVQNPAVSYVLEVSAEDKQFIPAGGRVATEQRPPSSVATPRGESVTVRGSR